MCQKIIKNLSLLGTRELFDNVFIYKKKYEWSFTHFSLLRILWRIFRKKIIQIWWILFPPVTHLVPAQYIAKDTYRPGLYMRSFGISPGDVIVTSIYLRFLIGWEDPRDGGLSANQLSAFPWGRVTNMLLMSHYLITSLYIQRRSVYYTVNSLYSHDNCYIHTICKCRFVLYVNA